MFTSVLENLMVNNQYSQAATQPTLQLVQSFNSIMSAIMTRLSILEEFDFSNGVEESEINCGEYKFS